MDQHGEYLIRRDARKRRRPDLQGWGWLLLTPRNRYSAHPKESPDDESARVYDEHPRIRVQTRHPTRDGTHTRLSARTHAQGVGRAYRPREGLRVLPTDAGLG